MFMSAQSFDADVLGTGLSDAFYEPSKTLFTKPKDFHKSVGKGIKSLIGHSLSSTIG
jgi:hypothetical protein